MASRPRPKLIVESLGDGRFLVSGHDEPHVVIVHPNGPLCDCKDFEYGKRRGRGCKHIDRVLEAQASGEFIPPAAEVPGLGDGGPGFEADVPPPEPLVARPAKPSGIVGTITGGPPQLPRVLEAERAVLGGIILGNYATAEKPAAFTGVPASVRARLDPTSFLSEANRLIYRAMLRVGERGDLIDPLTLRAAMDGDLDRAGGMEYIATLVDEVPTAAIAHIKAHVDLVYGYSRRRAIATLGAELAAAETSGIPLEHVSRLTIDLQTLLVDQVAPRFHWLTVDELKKRPRYEWLLDGFFRRGGLTVTYGPSGSLKTFVALGHSCCIAAGVPWLGRPTQAGAVCFVAAEGAEELSKRVEAWQEAEGVADLSRLFILDEPVNLMNLDEVAAAAATARAQLPEPPVLFVFDTLSDSMDGGDDGATKDMNVVKGQLRRLMRMTGAGVNLIHHTGRDETRQKAERGSIALRGGADVMFKLTVDDSGVLTLENDKQRGRAKLAPIEVYAKPIAGSLVIQPNETGARAPATVMSSNSWKLLRALRDNFIGGDSSATAWLKVGGVPEGSFYKAIKVLQETRYVEKRKGRYVLSTAGESALSGNYLSTISELSDSGSLTTSRSGGLI